MVYVFLADGFETVEALAVVDILRRAGIETKTVGVGKRLITSSHNIPVTADITEAEADISLTDAVVLPGGIPGTPNLEASETVQRFIDYCADNGKYLCAICAAPSILGHKGLLKGVEATSYPSFHNELAGAVISEKYVAHDKNFITARGAGVSLEFGAEIASVFVGREKADEILKSMQCK
ncbi:MAG: DJ-1/PfpI family protein [Ruminococcaceae bacterium]|nr:DJ-1/PfpI family protein [Oscillospiraceae bacterium]